MDKTRLEKKLINSYNKLSELEREEMIKKLQTIFPKTPNQSFIITPFSKLEREEMIEKLQKAVPLSLNQQIEKIEKLIDRLRINFKRTWSEELQDYYLLNKEVQEVLIKLKGKIKELKDEN